MNVAIIPARGGSKRIPHKNIRSFLGKPIICHVIEILIKSNLFDDVIVSSDDHEILDLAKSCGASTPFIRPKKLSDDFTGTVDVIRHAILFLLEQNLPLEKVCCIYPTAIFTKAHDLSLGLSLLEKNDSDYVFSALEYIHPITRSFLLNKSNQIYNTKSLVSHSSHRTQDLQKTYHDAGQWYWGNVCAWLDEKPIFSSRSNCLVLPKHSVVDIDTEDDWQFAEKLFLLDKGHT